MPQPSNPRTVRVRPRHRAPLAAALAAVLAAGGALVVGVADTAVATGQHYHHTDLQRDLDAIRDAGTIGVQARVVTEDGRHLVATSGVADLDTHRPVPANGYYRIGSNTKTFTATVVLQLAGEGKLSLDDFAEQWLPGVFAGTGYAGRAITIRQLLNHTSGIEDYDAVLFGVTEGIDHLTIDDVRKVYERSYTAEELVALALAQPPVSAPGAGWSYTNTGYLLAGMVIQEVTGNPWHEEVEQRIIRPLGLNHTRLPGGSPRLPKPHARGYFHLRADEPYEDFTRTRFGLADGGMVSTTADLDRFFRALLDGELLTPAMLVEMQETVPTGEGSGYGLGLESRPLSCGGEYWSHGGTLPGFISSEGFTEDGRSAVVSASSSSFDQEEGERQAETTTRLIDNALCDAD